MADPERVKLYRPPIGGSSSAGGSGGGPSGVFSNTTKTMLKNVIKHTNSHNKVSEMLYPIPASLFEI